LQTGHQLVAIRAVVEGQRDALGKVVRRWDILGYPGNRARRDGGHRERISLVLY
jgi:hypothetical protein